jgi:hypothetical protein
VAIALCARNGRACAPFRKDVVKTVDTERMKKKAVNVWEVQEAMALDDLKDNFRDALRSGFLTDVQSYDIRDNPDYFYAFGEAHPGRTYKDWFPPDPGPKERTIDPALLPLNEPNTESSVLQKVSMISSHKSLLDMMPTEATRAAQYGTGLREDEAVILKPRKFPLIGEGRLSLLWKNANRVVAPEVAAPPGVGKEEPLPPPRSKKDLGASVVAGGSGDGIFSVSGRSGKRAVGVLWPRDMRRPTPAEKVAEAAAAAAAAAALEKERAEGGGGGGGGTVGTGGAAGSQAGKEGTNSKGKKKTTVAFTEPERVSTNVV